MLVRVRLPSGVQTKTKIMATIATIKIEGVEFAKVYKHWDGEPSGMLPWLEDFNQMFARERGDDPTYKFAQLLRSSTDPKYGLDDSKITGYGVVQPGGSGEYEYTLHRDGSVTYEHFPSDYFPSK